MRLNVIQQALPFPKANPKVFHSLLPAGYTIEPTQSNMVNVKTVFMAFLATTAIANPVGILEDRAGDAVSNTTSFPGTQVPAAIFFYFTQKMLTLLLPRSPVNTKTKQASSNPSPSPPRPPRPSPRRPPPATSRPPAGTRTSSRTSTRSRGQTRSATPTRSRRSSSPSSRTRTSRTPCTTTPRRRTTTPLARAVWSTHRPVVLSAGSCAMRAWFRTMTIVVSRYALRSGEL